MLKVKMFSRKRRRLSKDSGSIVQMTGDEFTGARLQPNYSTQSEPDLRLSMLSSGSTTGSNDKLEPKLRPIIGRDGTQLSCRSPLASLRLNSSIKDAALQPKQDVNKVHLIEPFEFYCYKRPLKIDETDNDGEDYFSSLSDEIFLHIFSLLPKKALMRCSQVCTRFNRIVHTDSLWTRLDLGNRHLKPGALGDIVARGVVILRLAQANISDPIFMDILPDPIDWTTFESKLQYLDLSMATISIPSLWLLLSKCRKLKKLSLEHVDIDDTICVEVSENKDLETLNLTMCDGLTASAVTILMSELQNLRSLNISWTYLNVDSLEALIQNITPDITRLNIAGCKRTMTDDCKCQPTFYSSFLHNNEAYFLDLMTLINRCRKLIELDISDCNELTNIGIETLGQLKHLEYLSLSRCYNVNVQRFL